MNGWIDRVFINGQYVSGGMKKRDLASTKAEYEKSARQVLEASGADHVVYCYIEYDGDNNITLARFYSGVKFTEDEFYKATGELTGDYYVGAVHKMKRGGTDDENDDGSVCSSAGGRAGQGPRPSPGVQ